MIDNEILRSCDCDAILPELSAYIDGELSENEAKRIGEHLEKCEKCRRWISELSSLSEEIGIASVPYPDDLHSRIMDSLCKEMKNERENRGVAVFGKTMKKHGMWIGAGVAALICLALVGSPVFRGSLEFAVNDAKDMAFEMEEVAMPQNNGAKAACEISRISDADGFYYSYTAADTQAKEENVFLSDSLLDVSEEPTAEGEAPTWSKSYAVDMSGAGEETKEEENETDLSEAKYRLLPLFMLPRDELGEIKKESFH